MDGLGGAGGTVGKRRVGKRGCTSPQGLARGATHAPNLVNAGSQNVAADFAHGAVFQLEEAVAVLQHQLVAVRGKDENADRADQLFHAFFGLLLEFGVAGAENFIHQPNVLGIGEIGLNKNSRNELAVLEMHVDLAARCDQLVLVHTPHLEDKLKGTRLILDVLKNHPRIRPERVIIDHVEEHTVGMVLDAGFWAGMTLYPETKCTPARAVDILENFGRERLWLNSACDWGVSDPLAVPKAAREMKRRGHADDFVDGVVFGNPEKFLSQSPNFKLE